VQQERHLMDDTLYNSVLSSILYSLHLVMRIMLILIIHFMNDQILYVEIHHSDLETYANAYNERFVGIICLCEIQLSCFSDYK